MEAICSHFIILSGGKCILDSDAKSIRTTLGGVRSLDMKLRGDAARIAQWLEENKTVKRYSYSVDREKTVSVSFEYSSETDLRSDFEAGLRELGAEVISCGGVTLSISDVYCVLTHEAEEGKK